MTLPPVIPAYSAPLRLTNVGGLGGPRQIQSWQTGNPPVGAPRPY